MPCSPVAQPVVLAGLTKVPLVATLLTASGIDRRMKDKCLDMKGDILEKIKENKGK